jgi:hypothetical protein
MNQTFRQRRAVVLALVIVTSACTHATRIDMQQRVFAPQVNQSRSEIAQADLLALATGVPQADVLSQFKLPVMVHVQGEPCRPWDSCNYPSSFFVYRTREDSTCTVYFSAGVISRASVCEPFRKPLVLGPGDVDPSTGLTANQ